MEIKKTLLLIVMLALLFSATASIAGNKDKVGGAGAQELLIPVG